MGNYVGAAITIWREHRGEPVAGKLGKALKPLVARHPAEEVLTRFERFAKSPESRFGFFYFSEHFKDYGESEPMSDLGYDDSDFISR